MQDYVIGIDIGGTNIKAGAIDYQGNILVRKKVLTQANLGSDFLFQTLHAIVTFLQDSLPHQRMKAVGFGIPGAVQSKTGVVTQAPNLPALDGKPVRDILQDRLSVPCFLENDANAIALGEAWMGAGHDFNHICCLTLGTGVGGGVVIAGELLRGADGMAAELGHISVKSDGPPCNCGSFGCLETYASATGILRMLYDRADNSQSSLWKLPKEEITTAVIYEHAKKGDGLSLEILQNAGEGLGIGLASLVNIFNPEILIIGGGVAAAWDLLIPPAIYTMKARAFKAPADRVQVARAVREDDAGVYGNAYVAWDQLQRGGVGKSVQRSLTPWGFWEVLEEGADYKVKRLYIHPGHRLSYQKHQQREETWMIASGEAQIVLDNKEYRLKAGETIHVRKTQAHRIGNPVETPLIFFEVQRGTYFGEDDIVRLHDDYKRV